MEENQNRIFVIGKGILIAYLITFIFIVIYALLLAYTSIPESSISIFMTVIIMVSIFIASSFTVKAIKEKGLMNGAIIGIGYIFILYLLSSIFGNGFAINTYIISTTFFGGIAGIVGGIIGVNLR